MSIVGAGAPASWTYTFVPHSLPAGANTAPNSASIGTSSCSAGTSNSAEASAWQSKQTTAPSDNTNGVNFTWDLRVTDSSYDWNNAPATKTFNVTFTPASTQSAASSLTEQIGYPPLSWFLYNNVDTKVTFSSLPSGIGVSPSSFEALVTGNTSGYSQSITAPSSAPSVTGTSVLPVLCYKTSQPDGTWAYEATAFVFYGPNTKAHSYAKVDCEGQATYLDGKSSGSGSMTITFIASPA